MRGSATPGCHLPSRPPCGTRSASTCLLPARTPTPGWWRPRCAPCSPPRHGRAGCSSSLDDAHWADDSSVLVLSHALHRARGHRPVGAGRHPPLRGAGPVADRRGRADVDLGPLSEAAVFHLVRARLGRTLGRGDLRRLVQVSGGNPMYALELAGQGGPPKRALADPRGLVAGSVRGLPSPARRLLVAAALAHDPRLDVVARAAGLDAT